MKKVIFISILSLLFFTCASPYLGKKVSGIHHSIYDETGHHYMAFEHLTLDYDYIIHKDVNTITFDGVIDYHQKKIAGGPNVLQMTFTAYFLDHQKTIIGVNDFTVYNQTTWKPVPFKKTLPYDPKYDYVIFTYSGIVD